MREGATLLVDTLQGTPPNRPVGNEAFGSGGEGGFEAGGSWEEGT